MCEHVGNLMSLMKFLLWRKSWNGNRWALLNLQLSSTPASPSNPTLQEDYALSVLLLSFHMKGRTACGFCYVTPWRWVPWAGWCSVRSQAKQSLCCPLGKDSQKKARGDFSSCFGWVAYKVSRVYWILGCFCNLQVAGVGRQLLISAPWDACFCSRSVSELPIHGGARGWGAQGSTLPACCAVWPASDRAWDGILGGKTALPLSSKVLPLTLPLAEPWRPELIAGPATQAVQGGGGGAAAASGDRGGGCEVDHQTHLPCSGGTMGLSPEQSSPSQVVPPAAQITERLVHPGCETVMGLAGGTQHRHERYCSQAAAIALNPQPLSLILAGVRPHFLSPCASSLPSMLLTW